VAGGGQEPRLGLARHLELLVLAGQLGRGAGDAAFELAAALRQRARGLVEAVLQTPHLGRACDRHLRVLAGPQAVDRLAERADRRADAACRPPAGQPHAHQAGREHQHHIDPDRLLGALHRVEADLHHHLAGVPAVVADDRRHHLQAVAALAVGGFRIGEDLAVFRPDLHLLHMRLVAARLCGALQRAPVHVLQLDLGHGRDLQRHGLRIGAHQLGHAREVLARQHRDRAQRRHHGRQEREQHELLCQRQAHQQAEGAKGPVHGRIRRAAS
jgi:hypothetical protein